MATRAAIPAAVVGAAASLIGLAANGPGAAASAFLGVALVAVTFSVYVLGLGWARGVSPGVLLGVVMGGWMARLAFLVGTMLALRTMNWFDVAAFGIAVIAGALAVAAYEARLWLMGLGSERAPISPPAGGEGNGA
jgi:hypothetical protein